MLLLEKKIIRIVEERGYMGTKYIPIIKEIISYTQDFITNNEFSKNNEWTFNIPYEITSKIDCVDNLIIEVTIENNVNNGKYKTGGGSNDVFYGNRIVNGKLEYGRIKLYGYSDNKNLYNNTIFNPLSHELNHLQEIHKRMLKKDNTSTIFRLNTNGENSTKNTFSYNKEKNEFIRTIFYCLMRKSEFNALINSVYGDLDGRNCERRENFNEDIKFTQAYSVYLWIKDNIYLLNSLTEDEWDKIRKSFNMISANGAKPRVDIKNFKISFKKKVEQRLNDLLKGIGKIASFYYDRKEIENEQNDTLTMVDKSTTLKM